MIFAVPWIFGDWLMHLIPEEVTPVSAGDLKRRSERLRRTGVLLINLGTPHGPDVRAVRRYLAEFLSDPFVIRLPQGLGWLNGCLGRMIALFRARSSSEMYRKIWTDHGSPLRTITEEQTEALRESLPNGWQAYYAMRYGRPSIGQTLRAIEAAGIEELVVLAMYPHYSGPTTGTALQVLHEHLAQVGHKMHITVRPTWHDDRGYIQAQADLIDQFAGSKHLTPADTFLLFSAHGLPVSYVRRGDPYVEQVVRSVELVRRRLGWPEHRASMAYQSRFGPVKWLSPFTSERLDELAQTGERRILVCPISFTADCLETLEEINLRYRKSVEQAGAELYLCPALNTYKPFIEALKNLTLRGPRPIAEHGPECGPGNKPVPRKAVRRGSASEQPDVGALVMIGASLCGRLGPGQGPRLAYSGAEGFRSVKRPQCEVPNLLRSILSETPIHEAWLWNTCRRMELYGWLDGTGAKNGRADAIIRIRRHIFGHQEPEGIRVNVLYGTDAWHHLLRTAAGLNSDLPGERDVVHQLEAAFRLADRAESAGWFAEGLIANALSLERQLRLDTGWGKFNPDYPFAALNRIVESTNGSLSDCRITVIGGSTTSAGVLRTFTERFDVPSRQLTLLYRGHRHGGQIKILRQAIGRGRRIRVQSYEEQAVLRAVGEADIVVFGVDRDNPVLTLDLLRGGRDWTSRPLTIFDFNLFGSTTGLEALPGVTVYEAPRLEAEVAAFADRMHASDGFAKALQAAEMWILKRAMKQRAHSQPNDTGGIAANIAKERPARLELHSRARAKEPWPADRNAACTVLEGQRQ